MNQVDKWYKAWDEMDSKLENFVFGIFKIIAWFAIVVCIIIILLSL